MHEASIAANLILNISEIARQNGLDKVTKVRVLIGRMHHIVPEVLQNQFQIQKKRHRMLSGTKLVIQIREIILRCRACHTTMPIQEANFNCLSCGADDVEIAEGMEMHIVDIAGTKE